MQIIALCEVAQVPSLIKRGSVWVSPEEEAVVTRFLFAFPKGIASSVYSGAGVHMPSNTANQDFERAVRECIAKLGNKSRDGGVATLIIILILSIVMHTHTHTHNDRRARERARGGGLDVRACACVCE